MMCNCNGLIPNWTHCELCTVHNVHIIFSLNQVDSAKCETGWRFHVDLYPLCFNGDPDHIGDICVNYRMLQFQQHGRRSGTNRDWKFTM